MLILKLFMLRVILVAFSFHFAIFDEFEIPNASRIGPFCREIFRMLLL